MFYFAYIRFLLQFQLFQNPNNKLQKGFDIYFYNPNITIEIIEGIKKYMDKNGIQDIKDIIGSFRV